MNFDADAYWRDRKYKKWVVTIRPWSHRDKSRRDIIVGAKTRDGAIQTAKDVASIVGMPGKVVCAGVRLATPTDLGAVPAGAGLVSVR